MYGQSLGAPQYRWTWGQGLIGLLDLWSLLQAPKPFSELVEDVLPMHSRDLDLENRNVTPGDPETCGVKKESYTHSLGRTRSVRISKCGSQAPCCWVRHVVCRLSLQASQKGPALLRTEQRSWFRAMVWRNSGSVFRHTCIENRMEHSLKMAASA